MSAGEEAHSENVHVLLHGRVDDMILLGGGVIPDEDVVALKKMGVADILLQDTPPEAIVNTVRTLVRERGAR